VKGTGADEATASSGLSVMEGQGAYNRQSHRQAAGGALAVPLLEQAARAIDPGPDDRPLLIADYGSSQGRNSLRPMRAAVAVLRERFGAERPICVTHTDLPGNDFNSLFRTLRTDPDSYLRDQPNVFSSAVGRSFYESVLPPAQVSLGWSSYAAHWLSRIPAYIPGHLHDLRAAGEVREAFDVQARTDWWTFLRLRARELRPTGRLIIVLVAVDESGSHGTEPLFDAANDSMAELVARGTISAVERARMVIPARARSRIQLLAPFEETGSFADLTVEHCEVFRSPEVAWAAYLEHGDPQLLAAQRAGFFRSVFIPTLATALDPTKPPTHRLVFADELEATLARRLAAELFEFPHAGGVIVVRRHQS
jgi:hypothetical protein